MALNKFPQIVSNPRKLSQADQYFICNELSSLYETIKKSDTLYISILP